MTGRSVTRRLDSAFGLGVTPEVTDARASAADGGQVGRVGAGGEEHDAARRRRRAATRIGERGRQVGGLGEQPDEERRQRRQRPHDGPDRRRPAPQVAGDDVGHEGLAGRHGHREAEAPEEEAARRRAASDEVRNAGSRNTMASTDADRGDVDAGVERRRGAGGGRPARRRRRARWRRRRR